MSEAGLHPRRAQICPVTGVAPFSWAVDGFTVATLSLMYRLAEGLGDGAGGVQPVPVHRQVP